MNDNNVLLIAALNAALESHTADFSINGNGEVYFGGAKIPNDVIPQLDLLFVEQMASFVLESASDCMANVHMELDARHRAGRCGNASPDPVAEPPCFAACVRAPA